MGRVSPAGGVQTGHWRVRRHSIAVVPTDAASEPSPRAETFQQQGWVVRRGALSGDRMAELAGWVDEVAGWADRAGPGLHHHEATDHGPALARSERFADDHVGLSQFVRHDVAALVEEVTGAPAVLFKEKVNYKHPGGGGFAPHQDATAYRFVDHHVSVMVPLDPATEESGCLWFAPHPGLRRLEVDEGGRLTDEVVESLDWEPVEAHPGDVVVFDSYAPHRSGTNTTSRSRRAMYLTYNAASDGDFRAAYYADKEAEFAAAGDTFGGQRVRISISDDFLGRPVTQEHVVGELLGLYDSPAAHELYDEAVTELEHGLQAAALAEHGGAAPHLVAAALLHDVGHLLVGDLQPIDEDLPDDAHHEGIGAGWLRNHGFGPEVTDPIALHVAAKRYLCAVQPDYETSLSASSVRSLAVQGGAMGPAEAEAFEANDRSADALAVRQWDDLAKVAGLPTPPFEHWTPLLQRLLTHPRAR